MNYASMKIVVVLHNYIPYCGTFCSDMILYVLKDFFIELKSSEMLLVLLCVDGGPSTVCLSLPNSDSLALLVLLHFIVHVLIYMQTFWLLMELKCL